MAIPSCGTVKNMTITDYVGFIKKCMKLMQKPEYNMARKIDLEIQQLDDAEAPRTPGKFIHTWTY